MSDDGAIPIIVAVLALLVIYGIFALFFSKSLAFGTTVNPVYNVSGVTLPYTPTGTGGVILSASPVQFVSTFAPYNQQAILFSFLLNGYGQEIIGTQQLVSSLSSATNGQKWTPSQTGQVAITGSIVNETVLSSWQASGVAIRNLVQTLYAPSIPSTYTNGGGFCTSSYNGPTLSWSCSDPGFYVGLYGTYYNFYNTINNACTNAGGHLFLQSSDSSRAPGTYSFVTNCIGTSPQTLGYVYQPATPPGSLRTRVVVQLNYTNSTGTTTLTLDNQGFASGVSTNIGGRLIAQIVSLQNSPSGISFQQSGIPDLFVYNSTAQGLAPGTNRSIPIQQASYATVINAGNPQSVSSWYGQCQYSPPWVFVPTPYVSANCFNSKYNGFNQNLTTLLVPPQGLSGYIAGSTLQPLFWASPATTKPYLVPLLQVIAPLSTYAVYIPVANFSILSISPNPAFVRSGTVLNLNAVIKGTGNGAMYASCGQFFQSQNVGSVAASGQGTFQFTMTGLQNTGANNLTINCQLIVRSFNANASSAPFPFVVIVGPNCGGQGGFYNITTCKPINSTTIPNQCTIPNSYIPQNSTKCTCFPGFTANFTTGGTLLACNPNQPPWLLIVAVIIVVLIIIVAFMLGKR